MDENLFQASLLSFGVGMVFKGLERFCRVVSIEGEAISQACDEGVNIDLQSDTDIAKELSSARVNGDFPLVCVKGVVKTYDHDVRRGITTQDSSTLRSLDGRPCTLSLMSTYEGYDNVSRRNIDRTIRQVPWCLTTFDSKGPRIAIDQEAVRQRLIDNVSKRDSQSTDKKSIFEGIVSSRRESGYLRTGGKEDIPRSWWEVLTLHPRKTLVNHILPVLTPCSLIGSITLNTDGDYLLTAHPKYGFFLFAEIPFAQVATALKASARNWESWANRCGYVRSLFFGVCIVTSGILFMSKWYPNILSRQWWSNVLTSTQWINVTEDIRQRDLDSGNCENVRNMNMCVICLSSARTVLVRPCRHLCLCQSCYEESYSFASSAIAQECPICRDAIESFEVIYNP